MVNTINHLNEQKIKPIQEWINQLKWKEKEEADKQRLIDQWLKRWNRWAKNVQWLSPIKKWDDGESSPEDKYNVDRKQHLDFCKMVMEQNLKRNKRK